MKKSTKIGLCAGLAALGASIFVGGLLKKKADDDYIDSDVCLDDEVEEVEDEVEAE